MCRHLTAEQRLPPGLRALSQALAKDVEQRFQRADDLPTLRSLEYLFATT